MGIQRRKLVDEFWVNLANCIDIEETGVLKGLEDLSINIADICGIFLVIVLLGEGDVCVGIVCRGGGNAELGRRGKRVVLGGYNICISVLVISVGGSR